MAAVVRARCHFVDHQPAQVGVTGGRRFQHKKFNAQHADVIQSVGNRLGSGNRARGQRRRHIAFVNFGNSQNAVAVQIALQRQMHALTGGIARHDHRALHLQGQHFFQHTRHLLQGVPGLRQFGLAAHPHLALAVITHARRFQNARQQAVRDGCQLLRRSDHGMWRAGHATTHKMRLFIGPVLRYRYRRCGRSHRAQPRQFGQCRCRHIFKFGGNGAGQCRQLLQTGRIGVAGLDVVMADTAGRAQRVRVQHRREITHALGSVHKHAPELATAHHAQGHFAGPRRWQRPWQQGLGHQTGLPVTGKCILVAAWVWSRR